MKHKLILISILVLGLTRMLPAEGHSEATMLALEFLTANPVNQIRMPLFQAQPEIEMGISRDPNLHNEFATFNAGGQFHLVGYSFPSQLAIDLGGFGLIRSEFDLFSASFYHLGNDFHLGIVLGSQLNQVRHEVSVFHVSSHYGDDEVEADDFVIKNIGYETIRNQLFIPLGDEISLISGIDWKIGRRPHDWINDPLTIQLLAHWLPFGKKSALSLDCGIDYDAFNGLIDFGTRLEYLISSPSQGWREGAGHRFFVGFFRGKSSQGVFYNREELRFTIGMTLLL